MMILKFILFYGGALAALVATIFLWLFWSPQLKAEALCDDSTQIIRCTFQATRTGCDRNVM